MTKGFGKLNCCIAKKKTKKSKIDTPSKRIEDDILNLSPEQSAVPDINIEEAIIPDDQRMVESIPSDKPTPSVQIINENYSEDPVLCKDLVLTRKNEIEHVAHEEIQSDIDLDKRQTRVISEELRQSIKQKRDSFFQPLFDNVSYDNKSYEDERGDSIKRHKMDHINNNEAMNTASVKDEGIEYIMKPKEEPSYPSLHDDIVIQEINPDDDMNEKQITEYQEKSLGLTPTEKGFGDSHESLILYTCSESATNKSLPIVENDATRGCKLHDSKSDLEFTSNSSSIFPIIKSNDDPQLHEKMDTIPILKNSSSLVEKNENFDSQYNEIMGRRENSTVSSTEGPESKKICIDDQKMKKGNEKKKEKKDKKKKEEREDKDIWDKDIWDDDYFVAQKPTNWQNSLYYNPPQPVRPPSLTNMGATCYLNSAFQGITACDTFVREINDLCKRYTGDGVTQLHVFKELIDILNGCSKNHMEISRNPIFRNWNKPGQQDSYELLAYALNQVYNQLRKHKETVKEIPKRDLKKWLAVELPMRFIIQYEIKCGCGLITYSPLQSDLALHVTIPGNQRECVLSQLIDLYFGKDPIEDYECDKKDCSGANTNRIARLSKPLPHTICIHLQRTFWNGYTMKKINKSISFETKLVIKSQYWSKDEEFEAQDSSNCEDTKDCPILLKQSNDMDKITNETPQLAVGSSKDVQGSMSLTEEIISIETKDNDDNNENLMVSTNDAVIKNNDFVADKQETDHRSDNNMSDDPPSEEYKSCEDDMPDTSIDKSNYNGEPSNKCDIINEADKSLNDLDSGYGSILLQKDMKSHIELSVDLQSSVIENVNTIPNTYNTHDNMESHSKFSNMDTSNNASYETDITIDKIGPIVRHSIISNGSDTDNHVNHQGKETVNDVMMTNDMGNEKVLTIQSEGRRRCDMPVQFDADYHTIESIDAAKKDVYKQENGHINQMSEESKDESEKNIHTPIVEKDESYDLVSVIVHSGTVYGGHYICYKKVGSRWFMTNDSSVYEVNTRDVLNCQAYILFYEQSYDDIHSVE